MARDDSDKLDRDQILERRSSLVRRALERVGVPLAAAGAIGIAGCEKQTTRKEPVETAAPKNDDDHNEGIVCLSPPLEPENPPVDEPLERDAHVDTRDVDAPASTDVGAPDTNTAAGTDRDAEEPDGTSGADDAAATRSKGDDEDATDDQDEDAADDQDEDAADDQDEDAADDQDEDAAHDDTRPPKEHFQICLSPPPEDW